MHVGWPACSIITGGAGEVVPAALAVVGDVVDEGEVLVHGPRATPELRLILGLLLRSSSLAAAAVLLVDDLGASSSLGGGGAAPAPALLRCGHASCLLYVVDRLKLELVVRPG